MAGITKQAFGLDSVDADEKQLDTIRKHFFGILVIYIMAGLGLAGAFGLIYFLLPGLITGTDKTFVYFVTNIAALAVVAFTVLVLFIATIIYKQNRIILTDKNITQVLQYGLFSRKVSQLTLANVEDVTAAQHGILPTLLGYGTLKIETAGEQMNFHYTYCPRPNYHAKQILEARERFVSNPSNHASLHDNV